MQKKIAHISAVMKEITGQGLKDVRHITEDATPKDPVAGLLASQVNFYFHLVFFIGCTLAKRTSELNCFQRLEGAWVPWVDT